MTTEQRRTANRAAYIKRRAYYAARFQKNKEKMLAQNAAWRAANKDKVNALRRKRRSKNPAKTKADNDRYRALYKYPEKDRARTRAWNAANAQRHRDAVKVWRKANPQARSAQSSLRRARKLKAGGKHTARDIKRLEELQRNRCAVCRVDIKNGYHVDHIVPLKLRGDNNPSNLQLLCALCNTQKNAKHPIEFMQQKGFLL
jgi:5-methylcytosine-specific restriction endonuclease McrA